MRVACELARRGASVEVLDERVIGLGATQASAGILAPYLELHEGSPLLALAVRSLGLFDEFVEQVASDGAVSVSYHRTERSMLRRMRSTSDVADDC